MQTKINSLGEKYYNFRHKSGLEITVIPQKRSTAYAVFSTKFGSMTTAFKSQGDADYTVIPDGVAHFLEHKMFEEADGRDAFERFAEYGGDANAFTSFTKTVYLFSCTDNFAKNLEVLLDFVTHPHFTKKNVAKEQGIIGEEIRMYDDNPSWQVYFGMIRDMYVNNPINTDIAGTAESIAKITPEILYKTYESFYDLSNMLLVVSGDVDADEIIAVADKVLKPCTAPRIERRPINEPITVNSKYSAKDMDISRTMFCYGIKEVPDKECSLELDAAYEVLLHLMFDGSSDFYTKHYESGLINQSFSSDYEHTPDYFFIEISGESDDPEAVVKAINDEIAYRKAHFFTKEEFIRARNSLYANTIFDFDSVENVADNYLNYRFAGEQDFFDYPSAIASLEYERAKEIFTKRFDVSNSSLSVINPIKR